MFWFAETRKANLVQIIKLPRKTLVDLLILLQMYRHNLIEKELILLTIGCHLIKLCYPSMYKFLKALLW